MHNYINKSLNDFLSISRNNNGFYILINFYILLEELTEEEYIKKVKRFEKIEPNQEIGKISSFQKDQAKNRFREGLMKWLLHQRYFNLIIDPRHGPVIFQRFLNQFIQNKQAHECSICLLKSNSTIRLFCGNGKHSFCKECMNDWFKAQIQLHYTAALSLADKFSLTCPLCREPVD